jgi:hypothetical protein
VLNSHTGVKVNPCREIKMSRPPKRRGKLNAERFWKIHDALTPMGQCFLELTYLTRQRPTEIRLLRDSHIGGRADYIHFVPTKTEDSRRPLEVDVLITPEIRAAIERARALRPQRKVVDLERRRDPFIIQTRTGDGYSKNGLYEVWRDRHRRGSATPAANSHHAPHPAVRGRQDGEARLLERGHPAQLRARLDYHHRGLPRAAPRSAERAKEIEALWRDLLKAAEALNAVENGMDKVVACMEVFGRRTQDVMPLAVEIENAARPRRPA